jgi:WD40 repeat protein
LWNKNGSLLEVITGHEAEVTGAGFNPSGNALVTASRDGTARLWETHSDIEEMVAEAKGRLLPVLDAANCRAYFDDDICPQPDQ